MKQAKHKKQAAPDQSADVGVAAGEPLLPDADYVEQLLAAAAPVGHPIEAADAPAGPLCLPAQCLLRDAVEYRQHLLNRLPAQTVTVDVAAVERIDAAFLQVLLAFVRSRPRDGEPVTWLNVNSVFVEAATLLGVQAALAIPAAA